MNSLLDYLSAEVNCIYISDLKNIACHERILAILRRLETDSFALPQWQEAAHYIFNADQDFKSVSEVKAYFNQLAGKKQID